MSLFGNLTAEELEAERKRKLHDFGTIRDNRDLLIKVLKEGVDLNIIQYECYFCHKCGKIAYPTKTLVGKIFQNTIWPSWVKENCGTEAGTVPEVST